MNIKTTSLGLIIGLLSGVTVVSSDSLLNYVSAILFDAHINLYPAYGLIYGIITAPFFAFFSKKIKAWFSVPLWIMISGLSYFLALITTMGAGYYSIVKNSLPFLLGGLVGSFILLTGYHFLFKKINYKLWILTLLVGGACAWIAVAFFDMYHGAVLFLSWQTLITGLLASTIGSSSNTNKNDLQNSRPRLGPDTG